MMPHSLSLCKELKNCCCTIPKTERTSGKVRPISHSSLFADYPTGFRKRFESGFVVNGSSWWLKCPRDALVGHSPLKCTGSEAPLWHRICCLRSRHRHRRKIEETLGEDHEYLTGVSWPFGDSSLHSQFDSIEVNLDRRRFQFSLESKPKHWRYRDCVLVQGSVNKIGHRQWVGEVPF